MSFPTISQNALVVGLCPLIPLPLIDELLRKVMMKGAYLSIGEQMGTPLDDDVVSVLAKGRGSMVIGCLVGVVWWPIRKFLKTFFYFLTVKECFDWAAEAAVRGAMARHALERGVLPDKADEVRRAMDIAWKRHGGSPVLAMLLRREADPIDWGMQPNSLTRFGGGLARWGGGNNALAEFSGLMSAVEQGRPLIEFGTESTAGEE